MINIDEERIMAKGLHSPGPLLMVQRLLDSIRAKRLRIIVSYEDAADELVRFFEERDAKTEIDRAGSDFHVVVDLFKQTEGD